MVLRSTPPLAGVEESAVAEALARAGLRLDGVPETYRTRWRRTAAEEALDSQPRAARYTPSPRSTRGATRA